VERESAVGRELLSEDSSGEEKLVGWHWMMRVKSRQSLPALTTSASASASPPLPACAGDCIAPSRPVGLWRPVPRWFISCRNAKDLSLLRSSSSALFPLCFPLCFPASILGSSFPSVGPRCCADSLPAGSSGEPSVPSSFPSLRNGRQDLETPGAATKRDILLSQACPRISTKSLFRMHRSLSPGQKLLRIPHRGLRLFFVRFLSLPLPSGRHTLVQACKPPYRSAIRTFLRGSDRITNCRSVAVVPLELELELEIGNRESIN